MKTIVLGLILLACAAPAFAIDKAELDNRIRTLTEKFEEMQRDDDKAIPAVQLSRAHGIILLDRTKAGIVFAFQGGNGVALVKDPKTSKWSPAAFLSANEASLGLQIGGQQSFVAILLMDTNALRVLTLSKIKFGGEAGGTTGDTTVGKKKSFSPPTGDVRIFADRKGVYGGAAIKGEALKPDHTANRTYYGQFLTMTDILFDQKVEPSDATTELVKKLVQYSIVKYATEKRK